MGRAREEGLRKVRYKPQEVGMGYSERLRLLVGHALIYLNMNPHTSHILAYIYSIEHTTNIHLQTCASWRHVNQPETLPTY